MYIIRDKFGYTATYQVKGEKQKICRLSRWECLRDAFYHIYYGFPIIHDLQREAREFYSSRCLTPIPHGDFPKVIYNAICRLTEDMAKNSKIRKFVFLPRRAGKATIIKYFKQKNDK